MLPYATATMSPCAGSDDLTTPPAPPGGGSAALKLVARNGFVAVEYVHAVDSPGGIKVSCYSIGFFQTVFLRFLDQLYETQEMNQQIVDAKHAIKRVSPGACPDVFSRRCSGHHLSDQEADYLEDLRECCFFFHSTQLLSFTSTFSPSNSLSNTHSTHHRAFQLILTLIFFPSAHCGTSFHVLPSFLRVWSSPAIDAPSAPQPSADLVLFLQSCPCPQSGNACPSPSPGPFTSINS